MQQLQKQQQPKHLHHHHYHQQQQQQATKSNSSNENSTSSNKQPAARPSPFGGQVSLTASAKIQQRQQEFLAAAARSATSPAPANAASGEQKQPAPSKKHQVATAIIPPDHQQPPQQQQQNHNLNHQQQQQWKLAPSAHCPSSAAAQAAACPAHQQPLAANPAAQRAYAPQQLRQSPSSAARPSSSSSVEALAPAAAAAAAAKVAAPSTVAVSVAAPAVTPTTTSSTQPPVQRQQQLQSSQRHHNFHNFNINNNNNHYHHHHYNHHNNNNNHHHHHNHQQQQPHNNQHHQSHHLNTMAHYKFHNDCQSSVLTYEQVKRLDFVMDQTVPIHGRGNFPTLYVKLKELIRLVKYKLQKEHSIEIRDVRLNGGAASYVLAPENSHYNDLDLILGTDLSDEDQFDVIRDVVLECLKEFIPEEFQCQSYQMPLNGCSIKEAYVHKMVKVNDDDRWSLISLGVQQSEANVAGDCCGQQAAAAAAVATTGCSISSHPECCDQFEEFQQQQEQDQQEQLPQLNLQQEQQFAVTLTYENEPNQGQMNQPNSKSVAPNNNENHKVQANFANNNSTKQQQHQHQQITYVHHEHHNQRNHYQQRQQKQFPNSIELKFVDRMRRKFEFSVDSFQIILDSLIQFYDCAPQSTITSQRKLIDSHPSSTMINTRPLINKRMCAGCCSGTSRAVLVGCETNDNSGSLSNKAIVPKDNYNNNNNSRHDSHHIINGFQGSKQCASILNSSRSYYQLPIEPANSPSISSVASSSGCSSSSSVVSSSSSSLSCDDDHEDLYCDVDGPSSSSASTSSLLSSTNLSLLSSEGNVSDFKSSQRGSNQNQSHKHQDHHNNHHHHHQSQIDSQDSRIATVEVDQEQKQTEIDNSDKENEQPIDGLNGGVDDERPPSPSEAAEIEVNLANLTSSPSPSPSNKREADLISPPESSKLAAGDCIACLSQQNNLIGSGAYEFDTNHRTSCAVISENFYPTVIGRSEYGNFKEALYHLEKKLIATRSPEEIRGGGLLKYCNLLVKNYKPTNVYQIRTLERYMCSRFFIDFSDLNQQQAKLESYLANHFSDDPILKFDYLTILHNVVQRSTVCLMNHELRLTLNMIRDLAYKLNEQQQHQQQMIYGRK